MSFTFQSFSATHVGHVRSHNEDSYLSRPEKGLWVIADGMGGHDAGDFASQLIVETLNDLNVESVDSARELLDSTLYNINKTLIELGEMHARMNGSTAVVLYANDDCCHYVWAGDSRLYQLRKNKLLQLTKDHSQAEIYVELGMLTREEASQHVSSSLLTRCIGIDEDLELESGQCELMHGDRYLLCSDGLDKHVSHKDIERLLGTHPADEALNQLINLALERGGTDNITITIIDIIKK